MKRTALLATMCVTLSAAAQQTISIHPPARPLPALTVTNLNPDLLRGICLQAVQREQTATRKIRIDSVSAPHGEADSIATCMVKAQVAEGSGLVVNGGSVTTTETQYSVRVDLRTGSASVARIDQDAARQVALIALASRFLDLKPISIASDDMTFMSTVSGKHCAVEVSSQTTDSPKQWLVKKLDCER